MRLNENLREILRNHVRKNVTDQDLTKQLAIARYELTIQLYDHLTAEYDQGEMAILQKYDLTKSINYVDIRFVPPEKDCNNTNRRVDLVYVDPCGNRLLNPLLRPTNSFPQLDLPLENFGPLFEQCDILYGLEKDLSDAKHKLHKAYMTIIDNAATLEQISTVWPEAATILAERENAVSRKLADAAAVIKGAEK